MWRAWWAADGNEREGWKRERRMEKPGDVREEIKNSVAHELLDVPIRLPLPGRFVHLD